MAHHSHVRNVYRLGDVPTTRPEPETPEYSEKTGWQEAKNQEILEATRKLRELAMRDDIPGPKIVALFGNICVIEMPK